ncbi:MAG: aminoglycoside phosphotransferase family protein [Elusimicrobiota bacterium]|jgi:hypothetical protein
MLIGIDFDGALAPREGDLPKAAPFPGSLEFLAECRWRRIAVRVIGAKARAAAGDPCGTALAWMEAQGLFDPLRIGLSRGQVHPESTKREKLDRLSREGCTHFITGLPDLLAAPDFPSGVQRVLFAPGGQGPSSDPGILKASSWADLSDLLLPRRPDSAPAMDEAAVVRSVDKMLLVRGMGKVKGITPVPGASHNQSFRVETSRGSVFLKRYLSDPADPWERLRNEIGFSRFAWSCGLRCLPEPLDCDTSLRLGLYEFIEGERIGPGSATPEMVSEALSFFLDLNRLRSSTQARALPEAYEACMSIDDHLSSVDRRLSRLLASPGTADSARPALEWVQSELRPSWVEAAKVIRSRAEVSFKNLGERLPESQLSITPCDFGFHNAILAEDGRLRFLDFEFAGWDDPARTICDFFCRTEVPVPAEHLPSFVGPLWEIFPTADIIRQRVSQMMPVHLVKWCCILLDDFLPAGSLPLPLGAKAEDVRLRQGTALAKAKDLFKRLREQVKAVG